MQHRGHLDGLQAASGEARTKAVARPAVSSGRNVRRELSLWQEQFDTLDSRRQLFDVGPEMAARHRVLERCHPTIDAPVCGVQDLWFPRP